MAEGDAASGGNDIWLCEACFDQRFGEAKEFDIDRYATSDYEWSGLWEHLKSPVLLVLDEEGANVGHAAVRHATGRWWLYVDDDQGYSLERDVDVETWILTPEDQD